MATAKIMKIYLLCLLIIGICVFLFFSIKNIIDNTKSRKDFSDNSRQWITNPYDLPYKQVKIRNDLPESYDTRQQFPYCQSIHEIRDQAECGSCWAFAAVEVMSDRICIHSKGKYQYRLSSLHLMTCCSTCKFEMETACYGGFYEGAFAFWETYGIPSGGLYKDNKTCKPYFLPPCNHDMFIIGKYHSCPSHKPGPSKCENTCQSRHANSLEKDLHYAETIYKIQQDELQIMTEIYENGPVAANYRLYPNFYAYDTNTVYDKTIGKDIDGHAVKIIGWGQENNKKYWLIANSWNEHWGNHGFFKILRGEDFLGIESQIVAGIPKLK